VSSVKPAIAGQPARPPDDYEGPISDPDFDLLGTDKYARKLAEYILRIQSNFTVGIYGQWGAGKTSFVRLVERALGNRVKFISFSAWSFKTSDELWRALVLHIAKALYGVREDRDEPGPSLEERIRRFLERNAIEQPAPAKARLATYDDVLEELDATAPISIRKSRSGTLLIDEDQALVAMAQTVAAAVAAVSPLGGVLRSWFGGDGGGKAAKLLKQDTDDEARKRIDSVQRLRKLLSDIFARKAEGKRVCVFVDDLDRSLPDVAVDLLDAIQVFLGEVNCVFIVAADKDLVGRGLKVRFKDLMQAGASDKDSDFYARKGNEYVEKIIQFGVRVPQPTPAEGHRFIAVKFPGWVAASDLITIALEGNPRRMQQYGALLEYRHAVSELVEAGDAAPQALDPGGTAAVCEKIAALYWRDPETARRICELLASPSGFGPSMRAAEDELRRGGPAPGATPAPEGRELCQHAQHLRPVVELLLRPPLLSDTDPTVAETILGFADLEPDAQQMLRTRDHVFMRILAPLVQLAVSLESILLEDINRLLQLRREHPEFLQAIVDMAGGWTYGEQMQALERRLEDESKKEPGLSRAAETVLKLSTDPGVSEEERQRRHDVFRGEPRFSAITREVILLFAAASETLPDGKAVLLADLDRLRKDFREATERACRSLNIRIDAAKRHLERRRFAKVDVMIHCWQDLENYLNYDRAALPALEEQTMPGYAGPVEERFRRWITDERFGRFMRLQPSLRELSREIARVAAVTAPPTPLSAPPLTAPSGAVSAPAVPAPPLAAKAVARGPEGGGQVLFLRIAPTPDGITGSYEVRAEEESRIIQLNVQPLLSAMRSMNSDVPDNQQARRLLADVGNQLFQNVLSERMRTLLRESARTNIKHRLLLDLAPSDIVSSLPWEALYIPDLLAFPVLDGNLSMVRYLSGLAVPPLPTRPGKGPIRMLAVLSNPVDTELVIDEAKQILEEQLKLAGSGVRFDLLAGPTTLQRLTGSLRAMRPDIFLFFGHAMTRAERGEGGIILADEEQRSRFVGAGELEIPFREAGVSLAILLGSETAGSTGIGLQNSLAGRLVIRGIPIVIGSVRQIPKTSALMFTRVFFPTLFRTGSVESALADVRSAVGQQGWDWAAYALFSSVSSIENLTFGAA